ncbi:unnamed protein product [Heligmosomoides polygyrus]|uniref:Uncharacterized protein n=1 Tax=Heligmosomoides polygyrus TaxID=6339 RepID=A0A183GI82_HELPZ|nr:unnamed protein product [Heligmosomoides polygyrus]
MERSEGSEDRGLSIQGSTPRTRRDKSLAKDDRLGYSCLQGRRVGAVVASRTEFDKDEADDKPPCIEKNTEFDKDETDNEGPYIRQRGRYRIRQKQGQHEDASAEDK